MKIIARDEVLEQCSIGYKLLQTNICQNNMRSRKDFLLDLLPKAHSGLAKNVVFTKESQNKFYERFVKCIKTIVGKLKGRCPLDSAVLRNAVVFNPTTVVNCRESSLVKTLKSLLQRLVLLKLIPARIADTVITQYSSMRDVVEPLMLQHYLLWMNFIST